MGHPVAQPEPEPERGLTRRRKIGGSVARCSCCVPADAVAMCWPCRRRRVVVGVALSAAVIHRRPGAGESQRSHAPSTFVSQPNNCSMNIHWPLFCHLIVAPKDSNSPESPTIPCLDEAPTRKPNMANILRSPSPESVINNLSKNTTKIYRPCIEGFTPITPHISSYSTVQ
jgi:hypothetical protein